MGGFDDLRFTHEAAAVEHWVRVVPANMHSSALGTLARQVTLHGPTGILKIKPHLIAYF